jgi:hypothetical protein
MGATAMSHPYGNSILPRELGHAILDLHEPTYGRALMVAKHNMVHRVDGLRRSLDAAAEPYCDEPLDQLIDSHMVMYNLLGDPAVPTRLPPADILFSGVEGGLRGGTTARISGTVRSGAGTPALREGEVEVTLEVQRTIICGDIEPRETQDHNPVLCSRNHAAANDKVLVRATGAVSGTTFSVDLPVPDDLPEGKLYLKGYAFNQEVDAVGSMEVGIDPGD